MENQSFNILSAEDTQEFGENINNFHIKQELDDEAHTSVHPLQDNELEATLKVENSIEANDNVLANSVECELVEFESNAAPDTFSQNHMFQKIPKTETECFGHEPPSASDDLCINDTHSDSNSISDPEHDPFADIDYDSSSLQAPESSISNISATHFQLINAADFDDSSNLPSSANNITPTLKPVKRKRKIVKDDLKCQLCLETQTSKDKLTTHLEICASSHKNRSRFCVLCNSLFGYNKGYKRHAVRKHGIKMDKVGRYLLKCEFCPKCFLHEGTLTAHLTSCHKINSPIANDISNSTPSLTLDLQCKLCLETQSSESTLKTHVEICATSHKDRYRFCKLCNKLFYHPPGYRKHALVKHGIKEEDIPRGHPFKCQLCTSSFALKESLIAHSASRHESSTTSSDHKLKLRPFNCLECPLRFKSPGNLRSHIVKSHSGELPVKCQVPDCEKAFKSNHSRSAHLRKCHPIKPFQCQQRNCGKAFKQMCDLQSHRRSHKS